MKAGLWELEIPMNDGKPINTPITGREKHEDQKEQMQVLPCVKLTRSCANGKELGEFRRDCNGQSFGGNQARLELDQINP
jgi:hypothetical protein